jgi:hypothetical protein
VSLWRRPARASLSRTFVEWHRHVVMFVLLPIIGPFDYPYSPWPRDLWRPAKRAGASATFLDWQRHVLFDVLGMVSISAPRSRLCDGPRVFAWESA